jgi:large subunit ribosomal protein L23
MKNPQDILLRPVLTEKSHNITKLNWYVFEVTKDSNKPEIKYAVEQIYKVKVDKVKTLIVKGKRVRARNRVHFGKRRDWKKAYIKLKEGHKIDII